MPNQVIRQALFIDSKAEKTNGTATLQISQTSLEVRQERNGSVVRVQGALPPIYAHKEEHFLSSSLFLHYFYEDVRTIHQLKEIIVCCVPNGLLQERYNPNEKVSFWRAGRNAPSRGEDFRVRVSFAELKKMANWRVQTIRVDANRRELLHQWDD